MIFLILILGLILRLINLHQSLWLDESISALAVKSQSFWGILTQFSPGDVHPPLYYLVLKLWTNFFGYSEIALRFPSVLFGVVASYFVYLIAKKKIALLAALFLAVNPLAIYYSQEARMYSLALFAVTASFFFFLEKKWVWFCLSFLTALYSDYFPWLLFPVFFLLTKNKGQILKAYLLIFIFLLPWLPVIFAQFRDGFSLARDVPLWGQVVGGFAFKALPLTFIKFIIGRISIENKTLYFLIFGSIAAFYLWIIVQVKNKLLWLWLTVPIILGFLLSLKVPIYSYHRFLFVLPALCLLLAEGVRNNIRFITFIIVISFISITVFNLHPSFQREDWRQAVSYLQSDPGIAIIPNLSQATPVTYYDANYPVFDKDNFRSNLRSPVYLIRYVQEIFDPQDSERKTLETGGYKNVQQKDFNGVIVWKYVL